MKRKSRSEDRFLQVAASSCVLERITQFKSLSGRAKKAAKTYGMVAERGTRSWHGQGFLVRACPHEVQAVGGTLVSRLT